MSTTQPAIETLPIATQVHRLPWWPEGPRQPQPGLRTVVAAGVGVTVQEPFGRRLPWPGGQGLALTVGQVVWAVWTDRLLAGTIPGATAICTDPECRLPLYRRHEDGRTELDGRVHGPHFAVFDGLVLPGTDLP
ncbi:hypothetical protein [Demequina sp. NBRC 110053]|uniref:hypothetical protein n=1 Tax=Demequina sp. NBRC 110053 TaxID=1570342 RepID=UPI0009FFAED9|nr:hypothetical protein [Demequina sp. NBRC 110053]